MQERFPDAGVLWTQISGVAEVSHGGVTSVLAGVDRIEEELAGLRFRISPEAFFQTNTEMAERLYGARRRLRRAWPAPSASSTSTAGSARSRWRSSIHAGEVFGVDIVEAAIADAIENAELNEIDNAQFFAGDVREAIRPLAEQAPRPDVVVVDPPRAGLSKKVVRRLVELHARRIVYVSCNPTTLAPNARQIVDAGYRLVKVRGVDMFPHTPHLECVALLERASG